MIHMQLIARADEDLQGLLRAAIKDGQIRSFEISQVKGGLRIRHKKRLGEIRVDRTQGPLLITILCKNRAKEWQLLEAFVGRLAYHFGNEIAGINIQFDVPE